MPRSFMISADNIIWDHVVGTLGPRNFRNLWT